MTFSWTKLVPLSKIQFAFLILVLFYQIHSPSWLTFLLSLSLICLLVKRLSKKEFLGVFAILSFCALFLLYQKQQLIQKLEIQPVQITSVALVPDSIRINGDQLAVLGRHGKHSYQLFYRLKSQAEAQLFKKEHRWLVMHAKVTLEKAEEVRNFKGFNYQTFLAYQGIYRIGKVEQIEQLEVISPESICDYLSSLRRRAIVHCQQHFPRPMSHYLTGLLFGYLDKSFGEMTDYYSQLGIIHLFALSGMQVGFFLTCFRRVLLLLAVPLEWIKWIELPFACFYAALTGYSISVIRSLVQSQLRHLGIKGLDNLACTFLLVFLWDAHFLMTVGGVLTFSYSNPDWIMAGIYADQGASGTSIKRREQFQQMLHDCRCGKIDLIIVKSVSRFARNQLDFISIYRELKALSPPVGIYIEDINLNTLDTNSEFILGIMAIVAQGESEQKSASITWSVIERFKRGIPMIPTHNLLGYTKDQYGRVVIDETEAKIVRLIYDSYIEGMTASEIASTLMTNHIPTVTGLERWTSLAVYNILRNEKYKGEIIMQKTYTVDCFSHKTRKNNGEKPKYRLKNGIPSIIPESRWDLVQELLKQPRRKSKSTSEIFVPKLYIKKLKSGKLRDFVVLDPSWKSEDIHEVFK